MATEPTAPMTSIIVETEALKALQLYADNYSNLMSAGLGSGNKQIELGSKPFECRFCGGKPPGRIFRKRAHAVSELLGNKVMTSLYECDHCNERFSAFEVDLGKMTGRSSARENHNTRGLPACFPTAALANSRADSNQTSRSQLA